MENATHHCSPNSNFFDPLVGPPRVSALSKDVAASNVSTAEVAASDVSTGDVTASNNPDGQRRDGRYHFQQRRDGLRSQLRRLLRSSFA